MFVQQAVTIGEDWVAIATYNRNVRLFTLAGVQKGMFSIPGPVVCLAAHTNQLMVVYHRGLGKVCSVKTYLITRERTTTNSSNFTFSNVLSLE